MTHGDATGALDLREYLARSGVDAEIIDLGVPMTTAAAAAEQLGVPVGQIFKSLVLRDKKGEVLVVIAPGDRRVDLKEVSRVTGCKELSFAKPDVALRETGYPTGGTPPIGYPKPLRVVLDAAALTYPESYCGGGRAELLLRIRTDELQRASGAVTADVSSCRGKGPFMRDKVVASRLQMLVKDLFVDVPAERIGEDDGLQSVLGLDSVGFLELRALCENRFGIQIADADFGPDNFRSIGKLADLVVRLHAPVQVQS
jgi:Cys-tRNA(Pro)/Cys-tRNA(Cys) deacylase